MYPVSANPRARTSSAARDSPRMRGAPVRSTRRSPTAPAMPFRNPHDLGSEAEPDAVHEVLLAHQAASNRATWAVTSRRTAPTALCRYTPTSFAKSFPLPIGTTPSATSAPPGNGVTRSPPHARLPSPPTATTRLRPRLHRARRELRAVARPRGPLHSTDHPWCWNSRAMGSSARAAAPRPAAG